MFAQKALETIEKCVKENKASKDFIIEQMNMYLDSVELSPGSGQYTYVYQWAEWNPVTKKRKVSIYDIGN
jgi:hypothetical protein